MQLSTLPQDRRLSLKRPNYKAPPMQALVQIEMAAMPNLYAPVSIPDEPLCV